MVDLVNATIEQIDTPLRRPLLDVSSGSNVGGVQLQLPQAYTYCLSSFDPACIT